jgi:short subunit dehydrogenase-like uncharacterized protein
MSEREYEIVLFGATGFTGRLTAEYLADNAPQETRWAVAGRDRAKLEALRASLAERNPAHEELPLLMADVSDPGSMTALARSTMVVITTVGPYTAHGEPLVAACAAAGTDYVDLAGEPEFVDRMWLSYNDQAVRSGARLVHSCGFDSIPYDLGALFTVMALPGDVPIELEGFGLVVGSFSGGTYQSAIEAMARLRQARALSRERRAREGRPAGRRVHGRVGSPHNEPRVGGWVVPAPTIDPQHVLRSARALDRYGPDFTYSHYLVAGSLARALVLIAAVGGAATLAQLTPTREMLRKLKAPGDGPSAEQRARSHFRVLFAARAAGRRLSVEVSGGDPGYGETSKMLAESALCLAFDELPERSGQLTTAVAMGESLIGRLQRAGIAFRVVEEG